MHGGLCADCLHRCMRRGGARAAGSVSRCPGAFEAVGAAAGSITEALRMTGSGIGSPSANEPIEGSGMWEKELDTAFPRDP